MCLFYLVKLPQNPRIPKKKPINYIWFMKPLLPFLLILAACSNEEPPAITTATATVPVQSDQERYEALRARKQSNPGSNDTVNMTDALGLKQGYWKEYDTLRVAGFPSLLCEGWYIDSRKMGPWREYHPNGRLKSRITYMSDKPEGEAEYFNEDGSKK